MTNLISCPVCQNDCSSEAVACPQCGHPFTLGPKALSSSSSANLWKIGTVGLGIVLLGLIAYAVFTRTEFFKTWLSTPSQQTPSNLVQTAPTPEPLAILDLEAGIDYQIGGVQPVTSETFYLLDTDVEQILKSSGLKPMSKSYLQAYAFGVMFWADKPENVKAAKAIKEHVKYSAQTDLKGKARFMNVRPDNYYLFGFTKTRGGYAIWNSSIALKPGANSQILDSKNAAQAF